MALLAALACNANFALDAPLLDQPSFSCASPTKIEAAICADPALAARDRTMAVLYAAARGGALASGSSQEESEQKKWLKLRNEGCSKGDLRQCLADAYDDRLQALAVAALFRAHDAAMAELTRENPKSAPIYEAIYGYATIDNPREQAAAVEKLIAPIFATIHDNPWAISQLRDIPDARTAASSDHSFAVFLDVASVSEYTLTLPCGALVRRPGLMQALDSRFGGAIDGDLIQSDCFATMPPLPNLDRIMSAAVSVQPNCEGTIRFSLSRDYDKKRVAVLLHRPDLWKIDNAGEDTHAVDLFRLRNRDRLDAAVTELATYYSQNFAVSPQTSRTEGIKAVEYLLRGAFDLCEVG